MVKRVFNKELLNETLKRDVATLIGDYEKLNRNTVIKFKCNCNKEFQKVFRQSVEVSGFYCKECTLNNKQLKYEKTNIEKYGVDNIFKSVDIRK